MHKLEILERIDSLIIKGKLPQAIELLIEHCKSNESTNLNEVKLLSSQFHTIERKENIGLGEFNNEINRIAKAVLSILTEERDAVKIEYDNDLDIGKQIKILEEKIDRITELMIKREGLKDLKIEKEYFWPNLEDTSRNYLYSAELNFYHEDILYDYSSVVIQYSKAIENEFINKILIPYKTYLELLKKSSPEIIIEDRLRPIKVGEISLNKLISEIQVALTKSDKTKESLSNFIDINFSIVNSASLAKELNGISNIRNRAAHIGVITKQEASDFREKILLILRNFLNRPYKIR
ncbi:MAG: hypothetical protein R2795_25395 [Saprospiraceae bacterium]